MSQRILFSGTFLFLVAYCSASAGCEVYLANSTIPNAGLGIFSAIELNPGDIVGEGDVCIPITQLYEHHKDPHNPFKDYVWAGEVMGMKLEVEGFDMEAFCPGLDAAINCNLALTNVEKANPVFDDARLHRQSHPGAGAITPYHNGTTRVERRIPAGGELFKFYGDAWFTTRRVFDTLPLSRDFPEAHKLLKRFFRLTSEDRVKSREAVYTEAILGIRSIWNSRRINALPDNWEGAQMAFQYDIGETHQANATRSVKWLEENGKCVDHIYPGQSTIEGAGHGAFSKRYLPEGTVITGSPLLHIPEKDEFMPQYHFDDKEDNFHREKIVFGHQLMMNYCFGHTETTLMLCPYGPGVNYINHNQTDANVKLVWSQNGVISQDDSFFFEIPLGMKSYTTPHLALDYVATRDIKEGEELFLDYGDLWEEAWQQHVRKWEEAEDHAWNYVDGRTWNRIFGFALIRTKDEAYYDPYPPNLQIRCHTKLTKFNGYLREFDEAWDLAEYGFPCEIWDRIIDEHGNQFYNIRLMTERTDRWMYGFKDSELLDYAGVPRHAIRFFDLPYSTDFHLENAFRHEIVLPDELMQDAWRNVPKQESNSNIKDEL